MRSLAREFATQRNVAPPRHESWDAPGPWDGPRHSPITRVAPAAVALPVVPAAAGPTRRAVLRRALRMGLLRPAARLRDVR